MSSVGVEEGIVHDLDLCSQNPDYPAEVKLIGLEILTEDQLLKRLKILRDNVNITVDSDDGHTLVEIVCGVDNLHHVLEFLVIVTDSCQHAIAIKAGIEEYALLLNDVVSFNAIEKIIHFSPFLS